MKYAKYTARSKWSLLYRPFIATIIQASNGYVLIVIFGGMKNNSVLPSAGRDCNTMRTTIIHQNKSSCFSILLIGFIERLEVRYKRKTRHPRIDVGGFLEDQNLPG